MIWDSYNCAPVFRDGEFVIVPPEACKAVVEVKSRFRADNLRQSLQSLDAIFEFVRTLLLQNIKIKKNIFYFDFDSSFRFPNNIFNGLSRYYNEQAEMPMLERIRCIDSRWPSDISWSLFSVDAIFVLGKGAVLRESRNCDNTVHLVFKAYKTCSDDFDDHTYSFFEHEIHRSVTTIYSSGLYYAKQAGLQSVANNIDIFECPGKSIMILPELASENLWSDFSEDLIYRPKLE